MFQRVARGKAAGQFFLLSFVYPKILSTPVPHWLSSIGHREIPLHSDEIVVTVIVLNMDKIQEVATTSHVVAHNSL